jgi:hypothetical protein
MTEHEQSLKQQKLSEAERLWLLEASDSKFDPKVAKIRLHDRIPDDFDPKKLDSRLYANNKATPFGLYLLDREAPIFKVLDRVINDIRGQIFAHPGINGMLAADVAARTNLPEEQVGRALWMLGHIGGFFSAYSATTNEPEGVTQFSVDGDNAYDEFIRYKSVDELIERVFAARGAYAQQFSHDQLMAQLTGDRAALEHQAIKRDAAFVLMGIDPNRAELEDVYNAIKETCTEFGIAAKRADLIEHQDRITDRILEEIATSEFLIADLSDERPNVYYEVGYAHALHKKPILFRRLGTRLHFDLSVHNVPEYKNVTQLRELLRRRLEAILGRGPKSK